MARLFYTLLFYFLTPVVLLRLLWRSKKAPDYRRRWGERFGFVPVIDSDKQVIWVHSVSVGETLAALPLIKSLQSRYPTAQMVVTTTTPTGSARVSSVFGESVYHVYGPYDLPGSLNRFLNRVHPNLLVIMETELWPNLIHYCHSRNVPVIVANARLSKKSAAGYRKFSGLTNTMLKNLSCIAAQHIADAERFSSLGASAKQVAVTGNIKFDLAIDDVVRQQAAALKIQWQGSSERPVLLVASTHRGEDTVILNAFRQILDKFPNLLLVLVPRHPERFDEVAALCQQQEFSIVRRSAGKSPEAQHQILLGDTMGELLLFFGACDMTFVGGSLVPVGGHNLIEPAAWGIPILSGPELFNFTEASQLLLNAGGMKVCSSAEDISRQVVSLLADHSSATAMGQAAKQVAEDNRGALKKLLTLIEHQL